MKASRVQILKVCVGSFALGVASLMVLTVILLFATGDDKGVDLIFGPLNILILLVLSAIWYPFVNKKLKY